MHLSADQQITMDRWLSAVETGKPNGDYGAVTRLYDGPGGRQQITYGKHQTTENGGNLKKLIRLFLSNMAQQERILTAEQQAVINRFLAAPLYERVDDENLMTTLRALGKFPTMRAAQNEFFLKVYMEPAMKWADANGFTLPLSALVIYDSFIQSGSIRGDIRRRFSERPPVAGGRERVWIDSYIDCRHQWLKYWGDGKSPKSKVIRASSYRTAALMFEIERGNWYLDLRPMKVNGVQVV